MLSSYNTKTYKKILKQMKAFCFDNSLFGPSLVDK